SALQQRPRQAHPGKNLPRLLARVDRDGDESDQRVAPPALRSAGAEGVRSAHDGVSESGLILIHHEDTENTELKKYLSPCPPYLRGEQFVSSRSRSRSP